MASTRVDPATGNLLVAGKPTFPIGLSDPPPVGSNAPGGSTPAWAEIARAGVTFARNYTVWRRAALAEQLLAVKEELDAAQAHDLQVWLALAGVDNNLKRQALLDEIVGTVKGHPGLGVWKGPTSRRTETCRRPAWSLSASICGRSTPIIRSRSSRRRALRRRPRAARTGASAAAIRPYAAACDIHGVDIYPVSRPGSTPAARR